MESTITWNAKVVRTSTLWRAPFVPTLPVDQVQLPTFLFVQPLLHLSNMSDHATPPSCTEPRDVHENQEMNSVFDDMMMFAELKDENANDEGRYYASQLLRRPNLPLLFRADAHIVLACGKVDYLYHAQEAVRVAELGREQLGPDQTSEVKEGAEDLLDRAREALRRAECDSAELKLIKEGLKAGTIKKPKRYKPIRYGVNGKSLYLLQHQYRTLTADDEESDGSEQDSSEVEFERRTVGKIHSKVEYSSEPNDSGAEKDIDGLTDQDGIQSDSNSADASERPQSEVEESIRTKSKGKRKTCRSSDDSGVEEYVVDSKKRSGAEGRKSLKSTIIP